MVLRLSSVGNLWLNAPLRFAFCFCVSFPHLFIYLLLYVWFPLVIKPRVAMMISRFIIWMDDLLFSSVILSLLILDCVWLFEQYPPLRQRHSNGIHSCKGTGPELRFTCFCVDGGVGIKNVDMFETKWRELIWKRHELM